MIFLLSRKWRLKRIKAVPKAFTMLSNYTHLAQKPGRGHVQGPKWHPLGLPRVHKGKCNRRAFCYICFFRAATVLVHTTKGPQIDDAWNINPDLARTSDATE